MAPGDLRRRGQAAAEPAACIIPPQTIEEQAKAKAAEDAKLKAAFEGGQIADLNTLSVKQLQTLAKQNGVSIARTKADFIHLLDAAEPGVDHSSLAGAALDAKLKEHKIGLLRTKDDLIQLLAQQQASLKQAQQLADQLKKIPPSGGLHDLTVVELQEMAKAKGVSLNMTKQDVIDLLDSWNPASITRRQGATLIDARRSTTSAAQNKQQLSRRWKRRPVRNWRKKARRKLSKQPRGAINKAKLAVEQTAAKVIVPESPQDTPTFFRR